MTIFSACVYAHISFGRNKDGQRVSRWITGSKRNSRWRTNQTLPACRQGAITTKEYKNSKNPAASNELLKKRGRRLMVQNGPISSRRRRTRVGVAEVVTLPEDAKHLRTTRLFGPRGSQLKIEDNKKWQKCSRVRQ